MPVVQDNAKEAISALKEILTPDANGAITFGVTREPLRESQVKALTATQKHLEEGETIGHIVQPGGTGKTREGIALAYAMHKHNRNSLFVVPTQQALEDFVEKARALCPDLDVGAVYQDEKRIGRLRGSADIRVKIGHSVRPKRPARTLPIELNMRVHPVA
jgi:superfamily II DNA or RNA helicase